MKASEGQGPANISTAQLVDKSLFKRLQWLNKGDVTLIDFKKIRAKASVTKFESTKGVIFDSREKAADYLEHHVAMAVEPKVAYEDDEYFYFSGGTRTHDVNDFSTGLGIKKATGELINW